jgi:hypothetical protein
MRSDPAKRNRLALLAFTALTTGCALVAAAVPASAGASAAPASAATAPASAATAPASAAAAPAGRWGKAQQVGGLNALNEGGAADVGSVSCGSPGNCVAVGTYHTADHVQHAFHAEEKGGAWGPQEQVTSVVTTPAVMDSVSCTDAGDCAAAGHMMSSNADAFVSNEVNGTWSGPTHLAASNVNTEPVSVSCPPAPAQPGNCTVGGWFTDQSGNAQAFAADEQNGNWGPEQQVMALQEINAGIDTTVSSVSCASPGNCAAVGHVQRADNHHLQPFIVDEFGGQWTDAHPIPELSTITTNPAEADAVSCVPASPGNCALAGSYIDGHGQQQVFVIDEVNGDWISPRPVQGLADLNVGGVAEVTGISCGSPGNCAVSGDYEPDTNNSNAGFVAEEKDGGWQAARPVVGTPTSTFGIPTGAAEAVSCASAGNCVVGGNISTGNGDPQAAVLREVNGTWGTPTVVPGMAALSNRVSAGVETVSCASAGSCAIGGFYQDSPGALQAFIADESTVTVTALTLSAAKIKYGHDQAETLSVTVKARTGGTPGGQVTVVAGEARICVIKLKAARGTCQLGAKKLKPGTYQLTGKYGGSGIYGRSTATAQNLTVVK